MALTDLDLAWRTSAGSALLEAALDAEEDDPETVTAEPGVPASVLAGTKDVVESLARGLLDFDLPTTPPQRARVYAQMKGEKAWTRVTGSDQVPYAPKEKADRSSPRIDREIAELSAPMDEATEAALRESLRAEGCREALVVWQEQDVLLDGHHRLELCRELGIAFRVEKRSFPDRAAALAWFLTAQRARRSLTPAWAMYYLGRQYNATKQTGFKVRSGQSDRNGRANETSAKIASETGVGEKTVRRAAALAEALDALDRAVPHARRAVLNREIRLSRSQIEEALDKGVESLDDLRELAEPPERDEFSEILRSARRLRDSLVSYLSNPRDDADRKRFASADAGVRQALTELPEVLGGFLRDLGVAETPSPTVGEARP